MQRIKAYLVIGLAYLIACVGGYFLFDLVLGDSNNVYRVILSLLTADVAMTVFIWLCGLGFKNSSFYDAYWSLIPWLLLLAIMIRFSLYNAGSIIFMIVFGIWSFRLTFNWAYTCESLKWQDWRYVMYKETNKPYMWHIINFNGIHMMPTLFVFLGLIPAIFFMMANPAVGVMLIVGCVVILIGVVLESFADIEMHKFRKDESNKGKVLSSGLWKYSRHPNYLGEITVWLGVFLAMLQVNLSGFYWIVGFFVMVILFNFISIPMMEKRQVSRRPEYAVYQKRVSKLLLLPQRTVSEEEPTSSEN